jgi:hypothetical protein
MHPTSYTATLFCSGQFTQLTHSLAFVQKDLLEKPSITFAIQKLIFVTQILARITVLVFDEKAVTLVNAKVIKMIKF